MNHKRVMFFPSQLAALMGENQYKDKEEEFKCFVERHVTGKPSIIEDCEIPEKYNAFMEKHIHAEQSTRIKRKVDNLSCSEEIKAEMLKKIYTSRGNLNEAVAIKMYEDEYDVVVQKPTHFMKKHIIKNNKEFFIGGKIDGMITNNNKVSVVEVKNRQNHFFTEIPEYERIQIECYMRLLNAHECIFIQHFEQENQVDIYFKDDVLWDKILNDCSEIVEKVNKTIEP